MWVRNSGIMKKAQLSMWRITINGFCTFNYKISSIQTKTMRFSGKKCNILNEMYEPEVV